MSSHTMNAARIAFVIATIAVNGAPSYAIAGEPVPTEQVVYTDLDLNTPDGVATLDKRLNRAVRKVCYLANPHAISDLSDESRCRRRAMSQIKPQRELAIANARSESRFAKIDRSMQVADRTPTGGADH